MHGPTIRMALRCLYDDIHTNRDSPGVGFFGPRLHEQLHQISLNSDWNLQTIACLSHYLSLCARLFLFFGMSKPVCLGCLWSRVHASLSVDCLCSISQSISQHVELMWQSFNVPADQTATEIKNNKVIALPIQLGREPESSVELQLSCIWFSSPCSPLH